MAMRALFLLLPLLLGLTGCATAPKPAAEPSDAGAVSAWERCDYARAAGEFIRLAATSPSPQRQHYQLQAAEALLLAEDSERALHLLERMDTAPLGPVDRMRQQLLHARAALAQREAERALALLALPLAPDSERTLHADFHRLRAEAYAHLGNHLEAARAYLHRARYLLNEEDLQANRRLLWDALTQLSAQALDSLQVEPPPDTLSGWMALAYISKQYQLSPGEVKQLIADWRTRYPTHPADQALIDSILERSYALISQPRQIALLLPLSGRFAKAAAAVREGFLAAYYDDPGHAEVEIRVYDIGTSPARVISVYEQALAEGAEFVIGPLRKESVNILAQREEFPVPTLALNFSDRPEARENFFEFSLAPEDEAFQVAEQAWLSGYSHAAMFVPSGEWGERIALAFTQRWHELGGEVVTEARYEPKRNDFSGPMQRMLNLDASEARKRRLEGLLGERVEFIPRRRQDIDFVFITGFPRQARLIRPQLKFHHASHLPVFATSHVYSGRIDPDQDRDMDDIIFGDMPWTLNSDTPNRALRKQTHEQLHIADNQLQRLVAFGLDAYHLIPGYKVLAAYPFERYPGETGSLRIDEQHQVRRQLQWAKFRGGKPRLMQEMSFTGVNAGVGR